MNDKRRAEIKERVAAMPKGHYEARDDWSPDWWAVYVGEEEDERLVCDCTEDTATFYANAPADIRDLLADNAALAQELAQEPAALRALLAGAVPLLELAAAAGAWLQCEHCPARDGCPAFDGGARDTWPCYTTPAQLRKLAQALREALGEEET